VRFPIPGAYDTLIWVTKWATQPRESFEALVGFDENDMVRVTGTWPQRHPYNNPPYTAASTPSFL
jgi:hypothetical protein